MLVLDEQLLGRDIDRTIRRWYRGPVVFIGDLRPNTVIKDDAIPVLLRQHPGASLITINVADFWGRILACEQFCTICFALPDSRVRELPELLRSLFRLPVFRTKAQRRGKVVRVSGGSVSYYEHLDRRIRRLRLT